MLEVTMIWYSLLSLLAIGAYTFYVGNPCDDDNTNDSTKKCPDASADKCDSVTNPGKYDLIPELIYGLLGGVCA